MDEDRPPDPPDPGGTTVLEILNNISRKRQGENNVTDENVPKKTMTDLPSANIINENLYVHPSMSDGPKSYTIDDKGPFIVVVSREVEDPASGTAIRAIKFGQFLHQNKVDSILNDGIKNIGRNKVSVQFSNAQAANKFLNNPFLALAKYKAIIPTYNVTKMGLAKGVPIDFSMEELVKSLVLPSGCGAVMKARRLNRKVVSEGVVTWVPTQTVVITFRGQMLPERVFSYSSVLSLEPYKFPTIQCMNCCRFGHIKAQCRSKPRCYRCTQPHNGDSCDVNKESSSCLYCTAKHFAIDKACPEYARQQSIKIVMSQDNISYMEASSRFPTVQKSYADVAKEMFTPPTYSKSPNPSPTPISSYRKTVIRQSRPHAPMGKGYDRQSHQAIIGNCPSSLPNGCAILEKDSDPMDNYKNLLLSLTEMLINIISPCNEIPLPPNVAQNLVHLFKIINNGPSPLPTME